MLLSSWRLESVVCTRCRLITTHYSNSFLCGLLFQLTLLLLVVSLRPVEAETVDEAKIFFESEVMLEAGLSEGDVLERFGEPDSKSPASTGTTQSWHYGQSIIFLTSGVVSAWTNADDLSVRGEQRLLRRRTSPAQAPYAKFGWSSAWERYRPVTPEEVIEELLAPEPVVSHSVQ